MLDLSRPQAVEIEGPLGTTRVVVERGSVGIVESPCPHRLCIKKGRISLAGDMVACLPNGIVVSVTGESDYDGITP